MVMEAVESSYDPACLPELLPIYYKKLFPFGTLFKWMCYGRSTKSYFKNREFSFTLKDDIYIRYRSFNDQSDMEKEITSKCPHKIDIGAVYSRPPILRETAPAGTFVPQEKELVFDIDMTDYDEVRSCCSGADICHRCWRLMVVAVKVMDAALREDFGFRHLLWVYSGRRGVHCWVADEVARQLGSTGRSAVAEYLSVVKGGANMVKKVTLYEASVHPSVQRAIDIVRELFDEYAVKEQDFLGTEDQLRRVLSLVPDKELQDKMVSTAMELSNSKERWELIKQTLMDPDLLEQYRKSRTALNEIMLQYTYPRLDVNVSKGLNHLLKGPFCVHPKTGRVCVPFNVAHIDSFDPFSVPTLTQLVDELNSWTKGGEESSGPAPNRLLDYKKTSLRRYVDIFDEFVQQMEADWKANPPKEDIMPALADRTNW